LLRSFQDEQIQRSFEELKRKNIEVNETYYGNEVREKYSDEIMDASNTKLMGLTAQQFEKTQELSSQINEKLKIACEQGDPSSPLTQQVCALHKEWLGYF